MVGRIVKFELKKLFGNRTIIVMLMLLSLINIYKIDSEYRKYAIQNESFYNAHFEIYADVSGAWDNAKIEYVIDEYQKAKAIVDTGNYSTEPNQPDTHTGYIFGDCGLFEEIKDGMEYMYRYSDTMTELTRKAADNAAFYRQKENAYLAAENEKIEKTYQNRSISAFYDTWGLTEYFKYDFSTLLILILLVPMLSPIFSKEREIEMYGLLKITHNGRKLSLYKLLAGMAAVCIISLFFLLQDFLTFTYIYKISGLSQPIYALSQFCYSPLTMSVGGYILLNAALKTLGFMIIGGICMAFSAVFSNEILPFCLSLAVTVIMVVTDAFGVIGGASFLNPVTLLSNAKLFMDFQVIRIFDTPVFKFVLPILAATLLLIAFSILIIRLGAYSPHRIRRSKHEI